ncbi:MAG: DUF2066 domain-containing protein [Alphaproteobacteria bacterium]|nr:DUF2066 domain-containing protein [Alphaproteobacteria bacterium]
MLKKTGIVLVCLLWALAARADLYVVRHVAAEAEGETALQAREMALATAQTEAYWRLMRVLAGAEEFQKLPVPDADRLTDFVQGVSIESEKTTATKYIGQVAVQFKPTEVQKFLTEQRIPYLLQEPGQILLVPVWQGRAMGPDNPVLAFFRQTPPDTELFTFVLPADDEAGQAVLQEALTDEPVLQTLFDKYGVDQVLVAQMDKAGASVRWNTAVFAKDKGAPALAEQRMIVTEPDLAPVLAALWQEQMTRLEKAWRDQKTNRFDTPNVFLARVPSHNLAAWAWIQGQLKTLKTLDGFVVRAARPNQVLLALSFRGSVEQLNEQLKTIRLALEPQDGTEVLLLAPMPEP